MSLRLHVVGLPFPYSPADAYMGKTSRFVTMMSARGHDVNLIEPDLLDDTKTFDPNTLAFRRHNAKAITELANEDGILCLIAGRCQQPIAEALPHMPAVEFGIGYGGVFSRYRVFESYAWMHCVLGALAHDAHAADGSFDDTVIPNYYDPDDFPFVDEPEDYVAFVGRLIDRKGIRLAQRVCKELDVRLVIAGEGNEHDDYGEFLGLVDHDKRNEIMSHAKALIAPTQYVEPFGGVVAEAAMCGTPTIATDWGAFTETVIDGVTGFRCNSDAEFAAAIGRAHTLDRRAIRTHAEQQFSFDAVAPQYERYFERITKQVA